MHCSHALVVSLVAALAMCAWAFERSPKIPLTWVKERRTYAAEVVVDNTTMSLQIGTLSGDTWLKCSASLECYRHSCTNVMTVESGQMCVTADTTSTLDWTAADITVPGFPIGWQEPVDTRNIPSQRVASAYLPAKNGGSDPPVTSPAVGVLGLGRGRSVLGSAEKTGLVSKSIDSFGLFLANETSGSSLYIILNGVDSSHLKSQGYTQQFMIPLWSPQDVSSSISWTVPVRAFAFGDSGPVLPHLSGSISESDGILSANSRGIEVPKTVVDYFMSLGNISNLCNPGGNVEDPIFLSCDPSVFAQLPRITFYIDMYEFYLDPEDYTYDADDSHFNLGTRTFIMVAESVFNADVWILGAPFLRKFPTYFQNTDRAVTVFCVDGITCQTKQHSDLGAKSLESVTGGSSSSSSGISKV